jgi:hypothetical protein
MADHPRGRQRLREWQGRAVTHVTPKRRRAPRVTTTPPLDRIRTRVRYWRGDQCARSRGIPTLRSDGATVTRRLSAHPRRPRTTRPRTPTDHRNPVQAARIIRCRQTDTQRATTTRHAMMRRSFPDQFGGERSRERPCNKSAMAKSVIAVGDPQRRRRRPRPIPPVSKSTMRTMSRMVIMGEALPATE